MKDTNEGQLLVPLENPERFHLKPKPVTLGNTPLFFGQVIKSCFLIIAILMGMCVPDVSGTELSVYNHLTANAAAGRSPYNPGETQTIEETISPYRPGIDPSSFEHQAHGSRNDNQADSDLNSTWSLNPTTGSIFLTSTGSAVVSKTIWDERSVASVYTVAQFRITEVSKFNVSFKNDNYSFPINVNAPNPSFNLTYQGNVQTIPTTYTATEISGMILQPGEYSFGVSAGVDIHGNPNFERKGYQVVMSVHPAIAPEGNHRLDLNSSPIAAAGEVRGSGDFFPGTSVAISAIPAEGWRFIEWTSWNPDDLDLVEDPYSEDTYVTMDKWVVLHANFAPVARYQVTFERAPSHGGRIRVEGVSSDSGVYDDGRSLHIEAIPETGWRFVAWETSLSVLNRSAASTFVTVSSDATVTAHFEPINPRELTVNAAPAAGGVTGGEGFWPLGSLAPITATPNTGWIFTGWLGDGITALAASSTTVTMDASKTVTATFARVYTLSMAAFPAEGGEPSGDGRYLAGANASIAATPETGWAFTGWIGEGIVDPSVSSTEVLMDRDKTVTATFARLYHLTLSASPPEGGAVFGEGFWIEGTNAAVRAQPNTGWGFVEWLGDAPADPLALSTTILMNGNKAMTARFRRLDYALDVSASPPEGGSVTGSGIFPYGTLAPISATPASSDWEFTGWNGLGVASPGSLSTSVFIAGPTRVSAHFWHREWLRWQPPGGGSIVTIPYPPSPPGLDRDGDEDGDGFSNGVEILLNTDPRDQNSKLEMKVVSVDAAEVLLEINTVHHLGRFLIGAWSETTGAWGLIQQLVIAGPARNFQVRLPRLSERQIYRLSYTPPWNIPPAPSP